MKRQRNKQMYNEKTVSHREIKYERKEERQRDGRRGGIQDIGN